MPLENKTKQTKKLGVNYALLISQAPGGSIRATHQEDHKS